MAHNNLAKVTLLISIFTIPFLFCCSDKPTQPGKTPVALKILAKTYSIFSGGTIQLTAVAEFVDGTSSDVTAKAAWSCLPAHAGTVNETGLFIARMDSTGVEKIEADYLGQSASVQIKVTRRARSLSILPGTVTVALGGSVQFQTIAEFPSDSIVNVTNQTTWSDTPAVAGTIDTSGLFVSKTDAVGKEIIIAQFQNLSAQSVVIVKESYECPVEMVTIPAGSFIMGDDNGQPNEQPAHEVYLNAYQIGKYEVTNEHNVAFMN